MLVLTRKQQESVVVGKSDGMDRLLKVTVLEIHGGAVRLGFEAHREFPVHRGEVWERIHAGTCGRAPGPSMNGMPSPKGVGP
jgi:carbon storage regulator CsrA